MTAKQPAPDVRTFKGMNRAYILAEVQRLKENEMFCADIWQAIFHYTERGLLAPPPIEGWQPIETAPTDGTIVLLAWPNTIKRFVYNNEDMPDWEMEVREYCTHGSGGARSYHGQATHWMPLPQPPLTKGKG